MILQSSAFRSISGRDCRFLLPRWRYVNLCCTLTSNDTCKIRKLTMKGDEVYLKKAVYDESVLPLNIQRGEETPKMMSSASSETSGW